ncbi:MAG: ATP-binding protein [Myxococcota bacterium]
MDDPSPEQTVPDESPLRARVTAIVGVVGGIAVFFAVLATREEASIAVRLATYGLGACFLLVPLGMTLGLELVVAQQTLIGLTWAYSSLLALVTGGKDTASLLCAILVPFFAILCSGPRNGLVWSVVTAASFLSISAALALGYRPPVSPSFDAVAAWNLSAAPILVFVTFGLAASYEWLRSKAERELRREKQRADRLHAEQRAIDQRFQSELKALVDERTQALDQSNRELARSERLASIGTLAAGVAHEINNPVGGILLSAQYALACEDHPERDAIWRAALTESEAQAQRCARIVKALLRFAAGSSADKSRHDLNALVRRSLVAMRGGLQREELERIETELASDELAVLADPLGIEQIVVNLVRNALDASAAGAGRVRIATVREPEGPCLRIEDQGSGIRDGDLPRIFDPFFSTREHHGGTGLGLSIVHGIAQEHGASILVASEVGRGTRFDVRFPDETPAAVH